MEIERMLLIMLHVGSFVVAAIGVAYADLSLFKQERVDQKLLRWASQLVMWALLALWFTGALIVWIDTHFVLTAMLAMPKLLAKITVVTALSINGYYLHHRFFNRLGEATPNFRRTVNLTALMAAISGASWMFAAFLGMAKPLGKIFGYADFMTLYATLVVLATGFVLAMVRPRIAALLRNEFKARQQTQQSKTRRSRDGRNAVRTDRADAAHEGHRAAA